MSDVKSGDRVEFGPRTAGGARERLGEVLQTGRHRGRGCAYVRPLSARDGDSPAPSWCPLSMVQAASPSRWCYDQQFGTWVRMYPWRPR